MLRTELMDLTKRGEVVLRSYNGQWSCELLGKDKFRYYGIGITPEEAVSAAVEQVEYQSHLGEIR